MPTYTVVKNIFICYDLSFVNLVFVLLKLFFFYLLLLLFALDSTFTTYVQPSSREASYIHIKLHLQQGKDRQEKPLIYVFFYLFLWLRALSSLLFLWYSSNMLALTLVLSGSQHFFLTFFLCLIILRSKMSLFVMSCTYFLFFWFLILFNFVWFCLLLFDFN